MSILHAPLAAFAPAAPGPVGPSWNLEVGDYAGIGSTETKNLQGSWTPDYGIVRRIEVNSFAYHREGAFHAANFSDSLANAPQTDEAIRNFGAGTFEVHTNQNLSGASYAYAMWDSGDESEMMIREYPGDGGTQNFPTPGGWEVETAFVHPISGSDDMFAMRAHQDVYDVRAFRFRNSGSYVNAIDVDLAGGGVTVANQANSSGVLFRLVAWKKVTGYHGSMLYSRATMDDATTLTVDANGNVPNLVMIQNRNLASLRVYHRVGGGQGPNGGHSTGDSSSAPYVSTSGSYDGRIAGQAADQVTFVGDSQEVNNPDDEFMMVWWSKNE